MIEVDYLLTTSTGFLENLADKLSIGYGQEVRIENNGLVFPPGLAKGKFEYYSLEPDLSMSLIDCSFFEAVRFKRVPLMINYFHALSFNLSTISFMVERHNYSGMHHGEGWTNKILYSSSEQGLGWTAPQGSHIRMVVLYFTRSWLQRYYKIDNLPPEVLHATELMQDKALQFSLDLNLELLLMLQETLASPAPKYMPNLYYEGCAKKLIACVAARMVVATQPGTTLRYEEVMQVLEHIRHFEEAPEQSMPQLDELAQACFMSRSKFEKLFKAIYGKNITDFFLEIKMKQAATWLMEGYPADIVAQKLGYSNRSHFVKVFRSYYKTSPRTYRTAGPENPKNTKE